jgi:hypothetical protein
MKNPGLLVFAVLSSLSQESRVQNRTVLFLAEDREPVKPDINHKKIKKKKKGF